jgi:cytidine deaminase
MVNMKKQFNVAYEFFESWRDACDASTQSLIEGAHQALDLSYAPYSKFKVGAAILTSDNEIISGANQENASYSLTICAERTVLGIYASGAHKHSYIRAIAIAYATDIVLDDGAILSPCGTCRQHILEFQQRQEQFFSIIMTAPNGNTVIVNSIYDLVPFAFTGKKFLN